MKSNTTSSRPRSGAPPGGLLKFLLSPPMSLSESRFRVPSVPMLRPRFPRRRSYKFPKDVSTNSPTRPAAMLQSSVPTIVLILVVAPGKPCPQFRRAAKSGVLPDCGVDSSNQFVQVVRRPPVVPHVVVEELAQLPPNLSSEIGGSSFIHDHDPRWLL